MNKILYSVEMCVRSPAECPVKDMNFIAKSCASQTNQTNIPQPVAPAQVFFGCSCVVGCAVAKVQAASKICLAGARKRY